MYAFEYEKGFDELKLELDRWYLQLIWHSVFEIEQILQCSIDGHAPFTKAI